ncbi:MAG: hypothetical protein GY856_33240, partial [bacterium]|nr:hypothetical protein [bacterium]
SAIELPAQILGSNTIEAYVGCAHEPERRSTWVTKFVNLWAMEWTITYYSEAVRLTIDGWPVGIRAGYAHITERIERFGPNLGKRLREVRHEDPR